MVEKVTTVESKERVSKSDIKGKIKGFLPEIDHDKFRSSALKLLNAILVIATAYMFWKGLSVYTNSPSPIVVVLSGSMEPAFHRGDILFLSNRAPRASVGDIVVYNLKGKEIPIVHRVVRQHSSDLKQLLLTKGDNNPVDDVGLYPIKQSYLDRDTEIIGTVKAFFPLLGYSTILMSEYQWAKTAIMIIMGLLSLSE